MPSPTLLLVDDHALFRAGLALVLGAAMPGVETVEAASFEQAMALPLDHLDLVLLDLQLTGLNGLECIAPIKRKWPQASVVVVSAHDDAQTRRLASSRGAAEFVAKSESADRMVSVIRAVMGRSTSAGSTPAAESREPGLSARQCEVIDHLNRGLSNKLIARQLGLSENTVRRHVQDILRFFEVGNRAEAVYAARSRGLVG